MSDMAIKYGMTKRANKMAHGGGVGCEAHGVDACKMCHGGKMMAEGGDVEHDEDKSKDEEMIERIIDALFPSDEKQEHPSEEGDGEEEGPIADFEPNEFEDDKEGAGDDADYTDENSGDEDGDHAEDEDRSDIIERIMKMRRMKPGRNPTPA